MGLAIIDIDGVLADVRHRLHHLESRPKDWDGFFAAATVDPPLAEGLSLASELAELHRIVYLTGRPERCRLDTQDWLDRHALPRGELIMRSDFDRRPARLIKLQELKRLRREGEIALFVDDDDRVVEAAVAEGFSVRHATWMPEPGDPAVEQQTLFEAQETDGRT